MNRTEKNRKQGGISFFLSYIVLAVLSITNVIILFQVFFTTELSAILLVLASLAVGFWFGFLFLSGQISVLIHEYKHAILATLVGNRWKRIKLQGMSGSFQYSYTKDTAHLNAFISLAPYFLPALTFLGGILSVAIFQRSPDFAKMVLLAFHGAELFLNFKDASPIQTDLTDIRGGYFVAVGYAIVANIAISTLLLIGILSGVTGLELISSSLWEVSKGLVALIRAAVIPG